MGQEQRQIPCRFIGEDNGIAIATGNNAAWLCSCGYSLPLVGRTGYVEKHAEAFSVICPDCQRKFFVLPEDKDLGRAKVVTEVARD